MHIHSRRGFLSRTLGACWTGATLLEQSVLRAAQARAQASTYSLPRLFDIHKMAEGVYAAIARPAALTNCNAVIFENTSDLLIVDTHSKPSAVVSLVSQVRKEITTKPVGYIVNSHFHWDHTQGAPAYKRIAPHASVVASEATRRLLRENGGQRLKTSVEEAGRSVETYKASKAAAKTAQAAAYYDRMISETNSYISEMKNYTPVLPDVTFASDLTLYDKAHDLHLAFRGKGHTAGDVVVFCPRKKVVATGDLAHSSFPFLADGYPAEWPVTLRTVAEFEFEKLAGGHGQIQEGKTRIHQMADYIEELNARVAAGKKNGTTLEQLQAEIHPDSIRAFGGGYREFLVAQVRGYRPLAPDVTDARLVADSVKTNVAHIWSAQERS